MVFKATAENGGVRDPNIAKGRPAKDPTKKVTRRSLRQKEFLSYARKLRPHVAKALMTAVKMLDDPKASDTIKMKAADLILSESRIAVKEAFPDDNDMELQDLGLGEEEPEGIQPHDNRPVFSLKIVGKEPGDEID